MGQHMVLLEEAKGSPNDRTLQIRLERGAQGIAERIVHEEDTRGANLLGHFAQKADGDCGNAGLFNDTLDQSDGLIADRSDRSQ